MSTYLLPPVAFNMGKLSDTDLGDCFHDLLSGCGNNVPGRAKFA